MSYNDAMAKHQLTFSLSDSTRENSRDLVLKRVRALIRMHEAGELGGERMPEDAHPDISPESAELAQYFTLGMALNYQRNSYSLWKSCTAAWSDITRRWVFNPNDVLTHSVEELREALTLHRVALQPNNHVRIWRTICESLTQSYNGDIRNLFEAHDRRISQIKEAIGRDRKMFPYLAGTKICNYWLYVMLSYTKLGLREKWALNVAPDTHVINASRVLGIIVDEERERPNAGTVVAERWKTLLEGTELDPIDVHTPLWLWSRSGFIHIDAAAS